MEKKELSKIEVKIVELDTLSSILSTIDCCIESFAFDFQSMNDLPSDSLEDYQKKYLLKLQVKNNYLLDLKKYLEKRI